MTTKSKPEHDWIELEDVEFYDDLTSPMNVGRSLGRLLRRLRTLYLSMGLKSTARLIGKKNYE